MSPNNWPVGPSSGRDASRTAIAATQLFQLIALGRTTVVVPESAGADLRRDLAAVPVLDAPPVTTVIARPPHSRLPSRPAGRKHSGKTSH
ncbi:MULTISPECIES: hypothetical protein [Actinomadura]|uniref:Uncharacterized protein n=1 Tax=Actinomadura yumaensis TaxID=111807 RepID=A0ABW2CHW5_9ACTN|nr:hypothetical protein [Actinomadura sp. J1-007]